MASTPNRNYALPNRYHDVVDDITEMQETFSQIDNDVENLSTKAGGANETISTATKQILQTVVTDSTLQNIGARRFLALDSEEFVCLDSSSNGGGTSGQCTVKLSNESFDQGWVDILEASKNCQTVKQNVDEATGSDTIILSDETELDSEPLKPEFSCVQTTESAVSENNESFIFVDEIEEAVETEQIATNENNGIIKIGDGVQVEDGIITAASFSKATKDNYGIVKIGSGISVEEDGTISSQGISAATSSTFGVVKLGSEFSTDREGNLTLATENDGGSVYGLGTPTIVYNGIVDVDESTVWYRTFVTTDTQFSININFTPTQDFSFLLELVSDGSYIVNFADSIIGTSSTIPINRGSTKIYFTKRLGVPHFYATVSQLDAPEPTRLTVITYDQLTSNFLIYTPGGCDGNQYRLFNDSYSSAIGTNEVIFEFEPLICVDYIDYESSKSTEAMGEFILRGSNDKENWTTLLYRNGEIIYGEVYTDVKGCYRYYDLLIGYTSANNKPINANLYGTQIDNNETELKMLTPYMSGNITPYATLTASYIYSNSATNLTDALVSTYMTIRADDDGKRWIQYELTPAAAANLLELNFYNTSTQTNWFTLEGSNDEEEWDLLLERQYIGDELSNNDYRVLYFNFENDTEYKYYRLNCLATNDTSSNWDIYGFKLYRRSMGKHNFYKVHPTMSSSEQDGYTITTSGYSSSNYAWHLFDEDTSTVWTVSGTPAWVQIELPVETIVTSLSITSREDTSYTQYPTAFEILASNDGEEFETLAEFTDQYWSMYESKTFNFENETGYLYYRLNITASNASTIGLSEIAWGTERYETRRLLKYGEYLVPVINSNPFTDETGTYTITASSEHSDHKMYYLFDRSHGTRFELKSGTSGWVEIELPEAALVNRFAIGARDDSYANAAPRNYTLQASNNDSSWTTLFTVEGSSSFSSSELRIHDLENETEYKYYRLEISNPNNSVLTFSRWDLLYMATTGEY